MNSKSADIVAGAQFAADIFRKLLREVEMLGGTAEDLHKLTRAEGNLILRRMAECIVPTAESATARYRDFPIEELSLSVRVYNLLKRAQIDTIGELITKDQSQLSGIDGFGRACLMDVRRALAEFDLVLGTRLLA